MPTPLRVASVNVNGIRAAFKNGIQAWLDTSEVDILALQEVRATTEILETEGFRLVSSETIADLNVLRFERTP